MGVVGVQEIDGSTNYGLGVMGGVRGGKGGRGE